MDMFDRDSFEKGGKLALAMIVALACLFVGFPILLLLCLAVAH